jgi:hypothetical protein
LRSTGYAITSFARYVDDLGDRESLTVEIMTDWARRDKGNSGKPATWLRRLNKLRSFARYMQQFEPDTEVPDDTIFGRIGQRLDPHIYRDQEIVDLLAAARRLGPAPGLRGATYEALFGLIALPMALCLADIEPNLILAFLDHLEQQRQNSVQSRNLQLAARCIVVACHRASAGRADEALRATNSRFLVARGDAGGDRSARR